MDKTIQLVRDEAQERLVLGTILNRAGATGQYDDPIHFYEIAGILTPECFYNTTHAKIWEAMVAVSKAGDTPDISNIVTYFQKHGGVDNETLIDLLSSCDLYDIEKRCKRLKELMQRRKLWELGKKLEAAGCDEGSEIEDVLNGAQKTLDGITCETETDANTMADGFDELTAIIAKRREAKEKGETYIGGTPTGFRFLDSRGGLMPSDLIIIGGATSMGKTSFATSIILAGLKAGHEIAMFSLEMSLTQLSSRVAAMQTGIPSVKILNKGEDLNEDELSKIVIAGDRINSHKLHISDRSTTSLERIIVAIRSMKAKYGIKGAVIDYIKLIGMNGADYRGLSVAEKLAEASRQFKNLAKELDIWIICLSQLNTLEKSDHYPTLDNIYGSREIAAAADYVFLVYRAEYYNKPYPSYSNFANAETHNTALINVAKGRNTGVGTFLCEFIPEITLFRDLTNIPQAQPAVSYWNEPKETESGVSTPF